MPSASGYTIRSPQPSDYLAWSKLWKAYLEFYGTELPEHQYLETFSRLTAHANPSTTTHPRSSSLSPTTPAAGEIYGLLVISPAPDLQPVGLAHYLFHSSAWSSSPLAQCYLNDLYVSPEHRGQDLAERLIREVESIAKREAEGCGRVYWLTQPGNQRARKVYDRVCATEIGVGADQADLRSSAVEGLGDEPPVQCSSAEGQNTEAEGGAPQKPRTGGLMDRVVYKIDL
jgi:GNAT superfamily N-acetyltransferase